MTTPMSPSGAPRSTPDTAANTTSAGPAAALAPLHGLFCELHWGPELTTVRSFDASVGAVRAAPDEQAPVPLYGFDIPDAGWVLAERTEQGGYVIFPPPGTRAHRRSGGGPPEEIEPTASPDGRPSLRLWADERITLSVPDRELRIELFPSVVNQRVNGLPLEKRVGVIIAILAAFLLPLGFIAFRPDAEEIAEKNAKTLEAARRKKEAQRKQLEKDYPSWVDESAAPIRPEDGLTLPNSFTVN